MNKAAEIRACLAAGLTPAEIAAETWLNVTPDYVRAVASRSRRKAPEPAAKPQPEEEEDATVMALLISLLPWILTCLEETMMTVAVMMRMKRIGTKLVS